MKLYRHMDTGEIFTEEELRHDYEQFAKEMPYTGFENYMETMLSLGLEKTGGFAEIEEGETECDGDSCIIHYPEQET